MHSFFLFLEYFSSSEFTSLSELVSVSPSSFETMSISCRPDDDAIGGSWVSISSSEEYSVVELLSSDGRGSNRAFASASVRPLVLNISPKKFVNF